MFVAALRMEIAAPGLDAPRRVARTLLAEAAKGNVAAATMIADRLDGKVPKPKGGSGEPGPQRLHVSWGWITRQGVAIAAILTNDPALVVPRGCGRLIGPCS